MIIPSFACFVITEMSELDSAGCNIKYLRGSTPENTGLVFLHKT